MSKKILLAHIPYQIRGGEEVHVELLGRIYNELGYEVISYSGTNDDSYLMATIASLTSSTIDKKFQALLEKENPSIIHLHNAFPLLGPRFFQWKSKNKQIPLIMSIHNHRFFCTNGLALRENKECKACFNSKILWRSLLHNCNQNYLKTIYHSIALTKIRTLNLFDQAVDCFIAPSPYIEKELQNYGFSKNKIHCLLHAVEAQKDIPLQESKNHEFDIIYAGRLSSEKGISLLLEASKQLPEHKFLILGDGPEKNLVESYSQKQKNISFLGKKPHSEVMQYLEKSKIGIIPSVCNEILSLFALEVFAQGKYCIAGSTTSMNSLKELGFPVITPTENTADAITNTIRSALLLPNLALEEKNQLNEKIGIARFKKEIVAILEKYIAH